MKITNIWNHHLVTVWKTFWWGTENSKDPKNIPVICPKTMQLPTKKTLLEGRRRRKALAQHCCSPWGLGETKLSETGVNCYTWMLMMLVGKQQRVLLVYCVWCILVTCMLYATYFVPRQCETSWTWIRIRISKRHFSRGHRRLFQPFSWDLAASNFGVSCLEEGNDMIHTEALW